MSEEEYTQQNPSAYTEDNITHLEWHEHIRRRPGMYIGKLGDGTYADDGIYVLLKEVLDNSIDEFMMGFGKRIEVNVSQDGHVKVRDYGRGIPLGKVVAVASEMNTGGKYDSKAFKKSIGLNGVGIKAVNALSTEFVVTAVRDGQKKVVEFSKGLVTNEHDIEETTEKNGTMVEFTPDVTLFENYHFRPEFIEQTMKNYSYLNKGLTMVFNGEKYKSENGVEDLLNDNITDEILYPIIHIETEDLEIAVTHRDVEHGEDYFTFVNGQHTTQHGTHLLAFKEAYAKVVRDFYGKNFDVADIRAGIAAVVAIKVQEPVFESQTKTKLGSKDMGPDGTSIRNYVGDFLSQQLDNYLHRNPETAAALNRKIVENEKGRKAISSLQKAAREKVKKASLRNDKLRDCRIHLTSKDEKAEETCIFITEGLSASSSITQTRDANTQAVFSLRGKPLNTYGLKRDIVYKNDEFLYLQSALDIEDGMDNLRYNKIIIATDADVDGMHIRLLMITFFLQFFPEVIKGGHLFILQTPLFRVRNTKKKRTIYCYSEEERDAAVAELGDPEITRFKGLGEINPEEFKGFIGKDMRLDPVTMKSSDMVHELLEFYMGKNTPTRQNFIIDNLVIEEDLVENDLQILSA